MRDKQQTQVFNSVLCRHETCVCGEAIRCTCINWHIISATRMSCLQFFLCRFGVVELKSHQQNIFIIKLNIIFDISVFEFFSYDFEKYF